MSKTESSKKLFNELLQKEGQIRGDKLKFQLSFIEQKEGEEGINIIKKAIEELDFSYSLDKIDSFSWYPVGLVPIFILILRDQFNWSDPEIVELGRSVSKPSILEEVLALRLFSSFKKSFESLPSRWRDSFDVGRLKKIKLDKNSKKMIVRVENFSLHPSMCRYIEGFILGVVGHGFEGDSVVIRETECHHKKSDYDEFVVEW